MTLNTNKLVYIVDDEVAICDMVSDELQNYGFTAKSFHTGSEAISAIDKEAPAICIIDLGLPDMDGSEVIRHLKGEVLVGIIILSGRGSLPDKVLGLELGADDYLSKPFDPRELVARTNSILRRISQINAIESKTIDNSRIAHFDQWTYDKSTLTLEHKNGQLEVLSAAEAELLIHLLGSPQQILNRDQLMNKDCRSFDRSIDVRMSRIRKKIEVDHKNPTLIKTVYGAGYIFTAKVEWK